MQTGYCLILTNLCFLICIDFLQNIFDHFFFILMAFLIIFCILVAFFLWWFFWVFATFSLRLCCDFFDIFRCFCWEEIAIYLMVFCVFAEIKLWFLWYFSEFLQLFRWDEDDFSLRHPLEHWDEMLNSSIFLLKTAKNLTYFPLHSRYTPTTLLLLSWRSSGNVGGVYRESRRNQRRLRQDIKLEAFILVGTRARICNNSYVQ